MGQVVKSFGAYGLDKISAKVLIGTFIMIVLTSLISMVLKTGGIITSAEPIVMSSFGVMGVWLLMLGIYMLKSAFSIKSSYIMAKAEVVENLMTIAGRAIKLKFTYKGEQHIATVITPHGGKRKGKILRVLFNPEQPSTVYLYGFKFFFTPVVPVIIGCIFTAHVTKHFIG